MSAVGRRSGELSEQDLREINDYATSGHFTEIEKAILQYTTEVTNTPVRISEENFAVLKHHFTNKQLVELTANIAWENNRARLDHALGMESNGFYELNEDTVQLTA